MALSLCVTSANAALVPNGEFNLYKPGSTTVTAALGSNEYIGWGGLGLPLGLAVLGTGDGLAQYSDSTTGPQVDLPGWAKVQGSADLLLNGDGGSVGFNAFAAWGGDTRIVSAAPLAVVQSGMTYTISALVGGPASPDNGPLAGPLAFHLLANGLEVTPTTFVNPTTPGSSLFQTISRTYNAATMAPYLGQSLTIRLGVEDANNLGNRVVFDNVQFEAVPEPSSLAMLAFGMISLWRFRKQR